MRRGRRFPTRGRASARAQGRHPRPKSSKSAKSRASSKGRPQAAAARKPPAHGGHRARGSRRASRAHSRGHPQKSAAARPAHQPSSPTRGLAAKDKEGMTESGSALGSVMEDAYSSSGDVAGSSKESFHDVDVPRPKPELQADAERKKELPALPQLKPPSPTKVQDVRPPTMDAHVRSLGPVKEPPPKKEAKDTKEMYPAMETTTQKVETLPVIKPPLVIESPPIIEVPPKAEYNPEMRALATEDQETTKTSLMKGSDLQAEKKEPDSNKYQGMKKEKQTIKEAEQREYKVTSEDLADVIASIQNIPYTAKEREGADAKEMRDDEGSVSGSESESPPSHEKRGWMPFLKLPCFPSPGRHKLRKSDKTGRRTNKRRTDSYKKKKKSHGKRRYAEEESDEESEEESSTSEEEKPPERKRRPSKRSAEKREGRSRKSRSRARSADEQMEGTKRKAGKKRQGKESYPRETDGELAPGEGGYFEEVTEEIYEPGFDDVDQDGYVPRRHLRKARTIRRTNVFDQQTVDSRRPTRQVIGGTAWRRGLESPSLQRQVPERDWRLLEGGKEKRHGRTPSDYHWVSHTDLPPMGEVPTVVNHPDSAHMVASRKPVRAEGWHEERPGHGAGLPRHRSFHWSTLRYQEMPHNQGSPYKNMAIPPLREQPHYPCFPGHPRLPPILPSRGQSTWQPTPWESTAAPPAHLARCNVCKCPDCRGDCCARVGYPPSEDRRILEEKLRVEEQLRQEERTRAEEKQRQEELVRLEEKLRQEERARLEEEMRHEERLRIERQKKEQERVREEERVREADRLRTEDRVRKEQREQIEEKLREEERVRREERERLEEIRMEERRREEERARAEEKIRLHEKFLMEKRFRQQERMRLAEEAALNDFQHWDDSLTANDQARRGVVQNILENVARHGWLKELTESRLQRVARQDRNALVTEEPLRPTESQRDAHVFWKPARSVPERVRWQQRRCSEAGIEEGGSSKLLYPLDKPVSSQRAPEPLPQISKVKRSRSKKVQEQEDKGIATGQSLENLNKEPSEQAKANGKERRRKTSLKLPKLPMSAFSWSSGSCKGVTTKDKMVGIQSFIWNVPTVQERFAKPLGKKVSYIDSSQKSNQEARIDEDGAAADLALFISKLEKKGTGVYSPTESMLTSPAPEQHSEHRKSIDPSQLERVYESHRHAGMPGKKSISIEIDTLLRESLSREASSISLVDDGPTAKRSGSTTAISREKKSKAARKDTSRTQNIRRRSLASTQSISSEKENKNAPRTAGPRSGDSKLNLLSPASQIGTTSEKRGKAPPSRQPSRSDTEGTEKFRAGGPSLSSKDDIKSLPTISSPPSSILGTKHSGEEKVTELLKSSLPEEKVYVLSSIGEPLLDDAMLVPNSNISLPDSAVPSSAPGASCPDQTEHAVAQVDVEKVDMLELSTAPLRSEITMSAFQRASTELELRPIEEQEPRPEVEPDGEFVTVESMPLDENVPPVAAQETDVLLDKLKDEVNNEAEDEVKVEVNDDVMEEENAAEKSMWEFTGSGTVLFAESAIVGVISLLCALWILVILLTSSLVHVQHHTNATSPGTWTWPVTVSTSGRPTSDRIYLCDSEMCLREGSYLESLLSEKHRPCDNFYDHVCERWHDSESAPPGKVYWALSSDTLLQDTIEDSLTSSLQNPATARIVTKASRLFLQCVGDFDKRSGLPKDYVKSLFKKWAIGEWPVPTYKEGNRDDIWLFSGELVRDLGLGALSMVAIAVHPHDRQRSIIALDEPSPLIISNEIGRDLRHPTMTQAVAGAISAFGDKGEHAKQLVTEILRVFQFWGQFYLSRSPNKEAKISKLKYLNPGFRLLLKRAFKDVDNVENHFDVLLFSPSFVEELPELVNGEGTRGFLNYLGFRALVSLSPFMPEFPVGLRELFLTDFTGRSVPLTDTRVCLVAVNLALPACLIKVLAMKLVHTGTEVNYRQWLSDLQAAFLRGIYRAPWLDQISLFLIAERLKKTRIDAFFPWYLTQESEPCSHVPHTSTETGTAVQVYTNMLRTQQNWTLWQLRGSVEWRLSSAMDMEPVFDLPGQVVRVPLGLINASVFANDSLSHMHLARVAVRLFRSMIPLLYEGGVYEREGAFQFTEKAVHGLENLRQCICEDWVFVRQNRDHLVGSEAAEADVICRWLLEQTTALELGFSAFRELLHVGRVWRLDFRYANLQKLSAAQLFFVYFALDQCERSDSYFRDRQFNLHGRPSAPSRVNFPLRHVSAFSDAFQCAQGDDQRAFQVCATLRS